MSRISPFLAAVVVAVSALPAAAQGPVAPVPTPVVVTEGEAMVKRAPDQAFLSVATETRELRAEDARRKNAETMAAAQASLRTAGVPADAMRTTGYSLMPDMEWKDGRSTVKGYIVRNQLEVRVDELDKLGAIIDAANASRTTTLTIAGPRFALKNTQAAESEALRLAVQAAVSRAEAMAQGARRTLGNVIRIEDQRMSGPIRPEPQMMRATMAKAGDAVETSITPGEIEIRAAVTVTFELR